MKTFFSGYADDVFYWLGAVLISTAAAMLRLEAGIFCGGVFCLAWSYMLGRKMSNKS